VVHLCGWTLLGFLILQTLLSSGAAKRCAWWVLVRSVSSHTNALPVGLEADVGCWRAFS